MSFWYITGVSLCTESKASIIILFKESIGDINLTLRIFLVSLCFRWIIWLWFLESCVCFSVAMFCSNAKRWTLTFSWSTIYVTLDRKSIACNITNAALENIRGLKHQNTSIKRHAWVQMTAQVTKYFQGIHFRLPYIHKTSHIWPTKQVNTYRLERNLSRGLVGHFNHAIRPKRVARDHWRETLTNMPSLIINISSTDVLTPIYVVTSPGTLDKN